MEQPFEKPPFWPTSRAPFACYRELDTFLRMSSFAWHAELACRKWLERGTTLPGGLNIPKTTDWMAVLSHLNPPLDARQQFGISPDDAPDVSIVRAYQLLISGLTVEQVAEHLEEYPLPDNLTDFLVRG